MRRKYDFAFSLGAACLCSQTLRNAHLQYASFPLDWVYGGGMSMRSELVLRGFDGWFEQDDFVARPNPDSFGHDPYENKRTGMLFPHEFDKGKPMELSYPHVRARMNRRVARLLEMLSKVHSVLIVWIGDPRDTHRLSVDEIDKCLRRFESRYQNVVFDMLAIDCVPDVPPEKMICVERERFRFYGFDYKVHAPNAADWHYRQEMIAPFFSDIRVRDYRTRAERDSFADRRFENECARFGASSHWTLFWKKMMYKLGRFLKMRDRL